MNNVIRSMPLVQHDNLQCLDTNTNTLNKFMSQLQGH